MADKESFSARLDELMQERKMTLRQAEVTCGVPKSTIQDWKSGIAPTDFDGVRKLAAALGVSFSFLLTGADDTRPKQEFKSIRPRSQRIIFKYSVLS